MSRLPTKNEEGQDLTFFPGDMRVNAEACKINYRCTLLQLIVSSNIPIASHYYFCRSFTFCGYNRIEIAILVIVNMHFNFLMACYFGFIIVIPNPVRRLMRL
ncbi:GQ67_01078T0 [Komagataella phaffii]|nr:GQ67_01078T0 [Komagataella phaffii]AOA67498.1 GQ68_00311T0 [Komagataella phaffii GS115]CAH2447786.1 Predicted protein [Komagataella phaffii CBS 7435]